MIGLHNTATPEARAQHAVKEPDKSTYDGPVSSPKPVSVTPRTVSMIRPVSIGKPMSVSMAIVMGMLDESTVSKRSLALTLML
ncbi:hypothetical protein PG991_002818 [Apiospora marii]|uniref:Uncharacterized protein n=1 Tax=Apiospora marii TaxID=335849 RepID=A0ABR1SGG8_9PEZI